MSKYYVKAGSHGGAPGGYHVTGARWNDAKTRFGGGGDFPYERHVATKEAAVARAKEIAAADRSPKEAYAVNGRTNKYSMDLENKSIVGTWITVNGHHVFITD